jgi:uncharacterized cupredoxin-like copper-binding protein
MAPAPTHVGSNATGGDGDFVTRLLRSCAFGAVALGTSMIVAAAATSGAVAQEATPAVRTAPATPIDVPIALGASGITPSMTALIAGEPYHFVVTNADAGTHPFLIEPVGAVNQPLVADGTPAAVGGIATRQTQSLDWTFTEPGIFQMADDRATQGEPGLVTQFTVVPTETPTIAVTLADFSVTPDGTALLAGKPYLFQVTNTGAVTHEFVLEQAGAVDDPLAKVADGAKAEAEAEDIAPGETKTVLWTFPTPGAYQMACHVPGHFEAGMTMGFTVVA